MGGANGRAAGGADAMLQSLEVDELYLHQTDVSVTLTREVRDHPQDGQKRISPTRPGASRRGGLKQRKFCSRRFRGTRTSEAAGRAWSPTVSLRA